MHKNKRGAINFTMKQSEKEKLEQFAKELGLPVSEFVRRSVRVALPVLTSAHYPGVVRDGDREELDEDTV
jgi:hypothetical protein